MRRIIITGHIKNTCKVRFTTGIMSREDIHCITLNKLGCLNVHGSELFVLFFQNKVFLGSFPSLKRI